MTRHIMHCKQNKSLQLYNLPGR